MGNVCKRLNSAESNKIGARPVNQIAERAAIAPQNRAEIVGVGGKAADVTGERVIFSKDAVQFQLGCELKFELGPSSGGIESANAALWSKSDCRRRQWSVRSRRPGLRLPRPR